MSHRLLAALAIVTTLALISCGVPKTSDFVKKVAMSDLYEVKAGKIASEKGQSEAVKAFGRNMVEAHSKMSEELKGIALSEKLKVKLSAELDDKHRKMIDDLNAANGANFDRIYAKQQIRAHVKAAKLFDAYAEEGNNAALKQFAANALPAIKRHREEAEKLPQ